MPTPRDINEVASALSRLSEPIHPSIGFDINGTVDESPIFFQLLASRWPGKVYVITSRTDRGQAEADLARYNIRYDELILVDSLEAKAQVVTDRGLLAFFDDQDETLRRIPDGRTAFKIRNGGNFDHDQQKWLYRDGTGRLS